LQACCITKGGRKMGFAQPYASEEDNVCFVVMELKAKEVLNGRTVDCGRRYRAADLSNWSGLPEHAVPDGVVKGFLVDNVHLPRKHIFQVPEQRYMV
ncbi:MAG: hypothetical protein AAGU11_18550, partial [Syntrophobacteraceae bacterium]